MGGNVSGAPDTDQASGLPRPEYPHPHRVRPRWMNLNGAWEFAFDDAERGLREGWHTGRALPARIVVPFSFEAPLSGIGEAAAHPVVWYRREVDLPGDFLAQRLILHVGACDFATCIWVNGRFAGAHRGGYAPIAVEIQDFARPGMNEIVIRAEDRPLWSQPRGKQIVGARPEGIDYDRVTGIWQTVWLEPVPDLYVDDAWCEYRLAGATLIVRLTTNRPFTGEAHAVVSLAGAVVAEARVAVEARRQARIELAIPEPRLWAPGSPVLYDVDLHVRAAGGHADSVRTYTGLRELACRGREVLLNGAPFYFRAVLDQGYFPGGWYTAASDADLRRDIELMQAMGFNGARKHQKAEDPRWLHWADRLGFVVWGEMGSGREFGDALVDDYTREWAEVVRRDRMHPSIAAWVPLNESWGVDAVDRSARQQAWVRALSALTHALDGTRPVLANDGWQHLTGDLWGIHCYLPTGDALATHLPRVLADPTSELVPGRQAALPGVDVSRLPVLLTEFGGLACRAGQGDGDTWGYDTVADAAALAERARELVRAVEQIPEIRGFVWTQLADVQQEANGLLAFDRTPKVPLATLRAIFGRPR